MRSWCAVYVDVGYLLASAATRVTGSSLRSGIEVDYPGLIAGMIAQVERDSGLPLLRVNWYDSGGRQGGQPDYHQDVIGHLPRIKLRLGRLSYAGEQKGVDVRLGLDLALQGRARVADVVYLVSGDDDLTEAVEEAQGAGVQVVLLSVPGPAGRERGHAVSKHLRRAADGEITIEGEVIDGSVRSRALAEGLVPKKDDEGTGGVDVVSGVEVGVGEDASGVGASGDGASGVGASGDGASGDGARAGAVASGAVVSGSEAAGAAGPAGSGETEVVDDDALIKELPTPTRLDPQHGTGGAGAGAGGDASAGASTGAGGGASAGAGEPASPGTPSPVQPAPAAAASAPTPAVFGRKKASEVVLPGATPVWSSASGDVPHSVGDAVDASEIIDSVAKTVVASWCRTATPSDLSALRASKPTIPGDLDRALLLDLAGRQGEYDIDEESRYAVRDRFWFHVGRVRLG